MTKHRHKQEWIEEILAAARDEIDESGYTDFTMEALVKRTRLSKGGVYRFFGNKSEVGLRLFSDVYEKVLDFDVETCMEWRVPLDETVFRLLTRYQISEVQAQRIDRIWVRLLPQVLDDERFAKVRAHLLKEITAKLGQLARAIAARDGLVVQENFDERIADAMDIGIGLLEGFAVQSALGGSIARQGALVRQFVAGVVSGLFA